MFDRLKRWWGDRRKAPEPPVPPAPRPRPPAVSVGAKELRVWAPPPEIVEGPLTPLEVVIAAAEQAVAAPPPPPPPSPQEPTAGSVVIPPGRAPGERLVHLVFEDGTMVPGDTTEESAKLAYLARNILLEARPTPK